MECSEMKGNESDLHISWITLENNDEWKNKLLSDIYNVTFCVNRTKYFSMYTNMYVKAL